MNRTELLNLKKTVFNINKEALKTPEKDLLLELINEKIYNGISSIDVAYYFIIKAKKTNQFIKNRHLQHLVYLSCSYYLGLYNKSLINEDIKTWDFGPVITILYDSLRKYGSGFVLDYVALDYDENLFSYETKVLLDKIWDIFYLEYKEKYANPSEAITSAITSKDSLWHQYWFNNKRYKAISRIDIANHYSKFLLLKR